MTDMGGHDSFHNNTKGDIVDTKSGIKGGIEGAVAGSGGGALPSWWFEQQADLGKAQASMMRALGIVTILRGFEVNVPGQMKVLHPTANISKVQRGRERERSAEWFTREVQRGTERQCVLWCVLHLP